MLIVSPQRFFAESAIANDDGLSAQLITKHKQPVSNLQDILDLVTVWEARITPYSPIHETSLDEQFENYFSDMVVSSEQASESSNSNITTPFMHQQIQVLAEQSDLHTMQVHYSDQEQQPHCYKEEQTFPQKTIINEQSKSVCLQQEKLESLSTNSCTVNVRCVRSRDWKPLNQVDEFYCLPYKFYWKLSIDESVLANTDNLAVLLVRENDCVSMPESIHCEYTNVASYMGNHYIAIKVHFTTSSFMHKKSLFRVVMQNTASKSNIFVSDPKMIYSRRPRLGSRKSARKGESLEDEEVNEDGEVKNSPCSSGTLEEDEPKQRKKKRSSKLQPKRLKREEQL